MILCECILSDVSFRHVQNIRQLLQNDSVLSLSYVLDELLKYLVSDFDLLPKSDLLVIEQYFLKHDEFKSLFYHDVMMSAVFIFDEYYSKTS